MPSIDGLLTFYCCPVAVPYAAEVRAAVANSGQTLAKWTCPTCGTIYTVGALVESATTFVPVPDDVLDEAGVDTEDFNEPDDPDVKMCGGCDGPVDGARDHCTGCREYVCQSCRKRIPRNRHQVDEHWQEPKFAEVATLSGEDDGSVLTGDDAIFTAEN